VMPAGDRCASSGRTGPLRCRSHPPAPTSIPERRRGENLDAFHEFPLTALPFPP